MSKKLIFLSTLFFSAASLKAVTIINKTSTSITLSDFTFISNKEIYRMPTTLQPDVTFQEMDINECDLTMRIGPCSCIPITKRLSGLNNHDVIYVTDWLMLYGLNN